MTIIGLAGGSGAGKTTVSLLFAGYNVMPINTDEIYHELTSSKTACLTAIVEEFGSEILKSDGTLDRKKLGAIVYSDSDKRGRLNTIAHYYVLCAVRDIIAEAEKKGYIAVIVDAPLLFESGFDRECDAIVAVTAPEDHRINRIIARDGISSDDAKKRINAQLSDEFLASRADFIISNSGSIDDLKHQVEYVVKSITKNK